MDNVLHMGFCNIRGLKNHTLANKRDYKLLEKLASSPSSIIGNFGQFAKDELRLKCIAGIVFPTCIGVV